MKMSARKASVIPILLMVLLAIIGVAYSAWRESVTITASVGTGELDWQFTTALSIDADGTNDYHCDDGFTNIRQGDKNVGYTTVEVTDPHTVTMTMYNVYPSYFVSISVYAKNTGTIPLVIEKVIIDGNVISSESASIVELDLNNDGVSDIEIWWRNGLGEQLDPGEDSPEMSVWFHILQGCPEGATLSFTIEIVAIQWNEY